MPSPGKFMVFIQGLVDRCIHSDAAGIETKSSRQEDEEKKKGSREEESHRCHRNLKQTLLGHQHVRLMMAEVTALYHNHLSEFPMSGIVIVCAWLEEDRTLGLPDHLQIMQQ